MGLLFEEEDEKVMNFTYIICLPPPHSSNSPSNSEILYMSIQNQVLLGSMGLWLHRLLLGGSGESILFAKGTSRDHGDILFLYSSC